MSSMCRLDVDADFFGFFFLSGNYWQYIMKKLKNSLLHFKGV